MAILSDIRTTTKCCALNIHKRYFPILRRNSKFWATARGIYWVAVIAVVCVSYEIWSPLLLTSQIQLPRGPTGWCVWVSANQASSWSWGFREDCYFTHFVLWRSIDRGKFYQSRDMCYTKGLKVQGGDNCLQKYLILRVKISLSSKTTLPLFHQLQVLGVKSTKGWLGHFLKTKPNLSL